MMNQLLVVGRIVKDIEVLKTDSGKAVSNVTLAVSRPFKNDNNEYETDFIDCTLREGIAKNIAEYCKKGDLIGVKGRLQTKAKEENGVQKHSLEIIVEKVTFLDSREMNKKDDRDDR